MSSSKMSWEENGFTEAKTKVYTAAKEGKVQQLKQILEQRSKDDISKLVSTKSNGATPLIMAARNGHMTVVEYLVDRCLAAIEAPGSVTFDGETIDGAPPLWCAAAAGHIDIVKFLVKQGADVNKTTLTNSTPLRAASFDGHYEIVQYLIEHSADIEIANRHGHTCLMISCYKGHIKIVNYLIDKGANVNRKSLKGNTALHDCAESGSLDIMKLLLLHGAQMEKDAYGMTPLLAAAVTGHTQIVEFLIIRPQCTVHERVDALELLGATFVDKKRDMPGAMKYWKRGMKIRFIDPNNVIQKPKAASPIAAYENAAEVQTMENLVELISDPDDMRMQALLVRERILGPAHPDTSYYIRYRGAVYADLGNFERCITLWMYALDMQQKMLEPLSPMTQSSFLSFAELFSFMMAEGRQRKPQDVPCETMMVVFEKAALELDKGVSHMQKETHSERETTHFNRLLVILMHLVSLMCRVMEKMSEEEQFQFKKCAYKLVRLNPRTSKGMTLLHLACSKDTTTVGRYPVCTFPSVDVIKILLEVGASVSEEDNERNTVLHIAAMNKPGKPEVMKTLLNNGAHIDSQNGDRKTAMELMENGNMLEVVNPLRYMSLQCLAASKIVEHGIPYIGHVTPKLESFVKMH